MMKKWMLVLVLMLTACSSNESEETSENVNSNSSEVPENEQEETEEVLEIEEEEGTQLSSSSSSLSLERPTERRERDQSSILSYQREGIDPNRIEIPALDIDTSIENVGLLPNGQMDEPSTMEDVAWYEGGYMPGEQGSSVLAGHVDSRTGPAIFFDLHKLEQGDEIILTDEDGEEKVFVVQKSESYDRNNAPLQQIFGYSYRSQLNLITCTGEFNSEAGTHDERLVVYTVLKDDLQSW